MRRFFAWLILIAALGVLAYVISIPHSGRPCLVTPNHPCGQPGQPETHM